MGRGVATDPGRVERAPLAACAQDEEDGVHGGAVRNARVMASEWVRLPRGQQRFHLCPEGVGDSPAIILDSFHARRAAAPRDHDQARSPGDP